MKSYQNNCCTVRLRKQAPNSKISSLRQKCGVHIDQHLLATLIKSLSYAHHASYVSYVSLQYLGNGFMPEVAVIYIFIITAQQGKRFSRHTRPLTAFRVLALVFQHHYERVAITLLIRLVYVMLFFLSPIFIVYIQGFLTLSLFSFLQPTT